ncbi:MAG: hypothetical protein ABMA02_00635 [Saprospiraceae bacterium]
MNQTLLLFFIAAACAACSDAPASGKRSAECYVRYLKPENQLFAEAVLREAVPGKADPQPFIPAGGVRYGGTLMREVPLQGSPAYRLEQTGGYADEHEFTWSDEQKRPHSVKVNLSAITAFAFNTDSLVRHTPATFTWTGTPLDPGETLVLIWERTTDRTTVPMEIIGTPGQTSIEFPAAQLAKIEPGTWVLYIVRKKTVQSDVHGTSVVCTAEYYSGVDTVTMIER